MIALCVGAVVLLIIGILGMGMMAGKSASKTPVVQARSEVDYYLIQRFHFHLEPTDVVEEGYQMAGRDGPALYRIRTSPERVLALKEAVQQAQSFPPEQPFPVRTLTQEVRGPEAFRGYPAWWQVDDLTDREELNVTWSNPSPSSTRVLGVIFVISPSRGRILIEKWST